MSEHVKAVDLHCPECGAHPGHYCPFPIPGAYAGTYDYCHLARKNAAHEKNFPEADAFEFETKTPVVEIESMEEIMETLRAPGIVTPTSDRVTKPIRPASIRAARLAAGEE